MALLFCSISELQELALASERFWMVPVVACCLLGWFFADQQASSQLS